MGSQIPMYGLAVILGFFYYVFSTNPYGILTYLRIPVMIFTLVVVFGVVIFIEYYTKEIFQQDSIQEMGANFMRYLYKYGFYLFYLSMISLALWGGYTLFEKGLVFSLQQSTWATLGLLFLLLAFVNSLLGKETLNSELLDMTKNILLYLPCILTDLIEFAKKDYTNTPSTSFIVLAILIVYVILVYGIPFIQKVQYKNDGIQLVYQPMYLNRDPVSFSTNEINDRILKNRPFYDRWFQQVMLDQMDRAEKSSYPTNVEKTKKEGPKWVIPPDEITRSYYEGFTSLVNEDKQLIPYEVFKHRVEKGYEGSLPPDERIREYILQHPQILMVREKIKYMYDAGYSAWDALLYTLPSTKNPIYYYHYSLTAWVYLHKIQAKGYQLIYSFGSRPSLYYDPLESALLVILNYGQRSQRIIYKTTSVLFQRWNYIVMNYNYGSLDLFINNNLVGTYPDILTLLRPDDVLVVGSRDNKSIGGICNMKYYELPLGIRKIDKIYQGFHRKKIPI